MTVKKKLSGSMSDFIAKGAAVKPTKEKGFRNILIRIPQGILDELDFCVQKKPWINRTQWVIEAIRNKIKSDVDESQEDFRGSNK